MLKTKIVDVLEQMDCLILLKDYMNLKKDTTNG